jgi:hypothetical protein
MQTQCFSLRTGFLSIAGVGDRRLREPPCLVPMYSHTRMTMHPSKWSMNIYILYIYLYALTSHRHRSLGGAALSLLRLGKADEKGFERKSLRTSVVESREVARPFRGLATSHAFYMQKMTWVRRIHWARYQLEGVVDPPPQGFRGRRTGLQKFINCF